MAKSAKGGTNGGKSGRSTRRRRGRGEEFTQAKENAVEVRTVSAALPLPDPDKAEYHHKTILGYKEQADTANSRYRKALQAAQKDGIDTDSLLDANKFKRENDPAKRRRKLEQLAFFLQMEGYPIHITVSDTAIAVTLDEVEDRGFTMGEAGQSLVNDYPEGSDMAQRFKRGWVRGQAKKLGLPEDDVEKMLTEESGGDGVSATTRLWNTKASEVTGSVAGNA